MVIGGEITVTRGGKAQTFHVGGRCQPRPVQSGRRIDPLPLARLTRRAVARSGEEAPSTKSKARRDDPLHRGNTPSGPRLIVSIATMIRRRSQARRSGMPPCAPSRHTEKVSRPRRSATTLPGNSACRCARTTSAWRCSATAARGASMSAIRYGGLHSRRRARTDVRAKPKSRNSVLVERDCANDSRAAFLSDGRRRTKKPRFVDGVEAVIPGSVSVIDRCAVSRAGHPPKRPLGVAQVPGRRPTSAAARGRYRRDQSPESGRSQERNRYGCGDRDVLTRPICGVPL